MPLPLPALAPKYHFHYRSHYQYDDESAAPHHAFCYALQHINDNFSLKIARKYMLYDGKGTQWPEDAP